MVLGSIYVEFSLSTLGMACLGRNDLWHFAVKWIVKGYYVFLKYFLSSEICFEGGGGRTCLLCYRLVFDDFLAASHFVKRHGRTFPKQFFKESDSFCLFSVDAIFNYLWINQYIFYFVN